ncbi:hypothetical protein Tco_0474933 [Tanacetum coccineum]
MQALKASRKSTGSQPHDGGSREGTGTKPGVPDQSIVILKTLGEGTGAKPGGSKNESDYSEEENVYEEIDWVYSNEEDEKKDDDDDDKNDVDKEMKDAKVAESGNGDEEITDTSKADAKKTEEVKDDNKKAELPPSSSSLSASSGIGNKFLNLSSDKCTVRNLKDSTDAEINSLLDVQIQQEIPHILSSSILTVPVFVSDLEKDGSRAQRVDHTTTLLASLKSEIPLVVNAYLGSSLEDALQKDVIEESMQANVINEVKNLLPKFLPKAVSDFATLVIQSTIKTPTVLAQSSSQAQSSLKAAESLSKHKLKMILFEKMDKIRSYLTHDKHQALFELYSIHYALMMLLHMGKKTKRRRTKESESYKKTSTTKETSKSNAPTKGSKSDKSVHVEELVAEPTKEVIMHASKVDVVNDADQLKNDPAPKHNWFTQHPRPPTLDPEWNKGKAIDDSRPGRLTVPLDYFFNNDLEYLKSSDPEKKYTTSITKMKAARYESQLNRFSKHDVYSHLKILSVKSVKVNKLHGYGYLEEIMVRRADRQLYKFKEGDFVNLHLNDIEDMLLLIYTPSFDPPGVVYEYLNKKKRVMQIDELYKFLDRTLKLVCDELHHRILNFRLGYNKEISRRKWSATDKRRSELMAKLIDKQMRERQIIRNLERLVGARNQVNTYAIRNTKLLSGIEDSHHGPSDAMRNPSQPLKVVKEFLAKSSLLVTMPLFAIFTNKLSEDHCVLNKTLTRFREPLSILYAKVLPTRVSLRILSIEKLVCREDLTEGKHNLSSYELKVNHILDTEHDSRHSRSDPYLVAMFYEVTLSDPYSAVMAAPTIPVSAEENLGDPIDIRMDVIHPEPVAIVAFLAVSVLRTLDRHGEVIGGIQEQLLEMPTQRWEGIEEELLTLRERTNKAETEGNHIAALQYEIIELLRPIGFMT